MPIVYKNGGPNLNIAPAQDEESTLSKVLAHPGSVIAGLLRAGGGVAGAKGGPLGALVGAGAEGYAELAEGAENPEKFTQLAPEDTFVGGLQHKLDAEEGDSPTTGWWKGLLQGALMPFARMGVAAGIGAVPAAATVKPGFALNSLVRGGALGAAGEAGREAASGEHVDLGRIGTAAAFSGGVSAALSKLLGPAMAKRGLVDEGEEAAKVAAPIRTDRMTAGATIEKGKPGQVGWTADVPAAPTEAAPLSVTAPTRRTVGWGDVPPASTTAPNGWYVAPSATTGRDLATLLQVEKAHAAANKMVATEQAAAAKAQAAANAEKADAEKTFNSFLESNAKARQSELQRAKAEYDGLVADREIEAAKANREPTAPLSVSETFSTTGPNGSKLRGNRTWVDPEEGAGAGLDDVGDIEPELTPLEKMLNRVRKQQEDKALRDQANKILAEEARVKAAEEKARATQGLQRQNLNEPPPTEPNLPPEFAPVEPKPPQGPVTGATAPAPSKDDLIDRIMEKSANGEALGTEEARQAAAARANLDAARAEAELQAGASRGQTPKVEPDLGDPTNPNSIAYARQNFTKSENEILDHLGEQYRAAKEAEAQAKAAVAAGAGPEAQGALAAAKEQRAVIGRTLRDIKTKAETGYRQRLAAQGTAPVVAEPPAAPPPPTAPPPNLADATTPEEILAAHRAGAQPASQTELDQWINAITNGKGTTELGGGLGAVPANLNPKQKALYTKLALMLAGGTVGATTDPLGNPLLSMLAGGAAGYMAPTAIKALSEIGVPGGLLDKAKGLKPTEANIKAAAQEMYESLPHYTRGNYLMSARGMAANAVAGPYGSGLLAGIELALKGDPRGVEIIKKFANPANFGREMYGSWNRAKEIIGRAEGEAMNDAPSVPRMIYSIPGTLMAAGDEGTRRILTAAGLPEDVARTYTLTSEPVFEAGRAMSNFGKNSPILQVLDPFRRTMANIIEQGSLRFPGVGELVRILGDAPAPIRQRVVEQGMGGAILAASYMLGEHVSPEDAKVLRSFVSNFGGVYSLEAAMGFAAGQMAKKGKSGAMGAVNEFTNTLPLPATDPIKDVATFAMGNAKGEHPVPRGMYPKAAMSDLEQLAKFLRGQVKKPDTGGGF